MTAAATPADDTPLGIAVDVVLVATAPGHGAPLVLAVPRRREPFAGCWALPGGRPRADEDLEEAARRFLADAAGLDEPRHLEQLASFGAPERDPRGRVVSVSYLALSPEPVAPPGHSRWWPLDALPPLAFDHEDVVASALERLRGKLSYSTVAYGLLPDEFTLSELQDVYEVVLGRELDKRNFRKKVLSLGVLEEGHGMRRGSHRPAQLHRFRTGGLVLLDAVIPT